MCLCVCVCVCVCCLWCLWCLLCCRRSIHIKHKNTVCINTVCICRRGRLLHRVFVISRFEFFFSIMGNASSADTNDGMRLRLHSLVNQAPGLTPADVDKIYRCFRKYCVQGTCSVSNERTKNRRRIHHSLSRFQERCFWTTKDLWN